MTAYAPHRRPAGRLSIADIDVVRNAAGPGSRFVIWFQGCRRRCPGCANPSFQGMAGETSLTPDQLARQVRQARGIRGITLSGGEPFLQAPGIAAFLGLVDRAALTVVCYTGYRIDELNQGAVAGARELLCAVDLLIDGEYRRELPPGGVYRSSSNQRLHFLSSRIRPEECVQDFETTISISRSLAVSTGELPTRVAQRLLDGLKQSGISFT